MADWMSEQQEIFFMRQQRQLVENGFTMRDPAIEEGLMQIYWRTGNTYRVLFLEEIVAALAKDPSIEPALVAQAEEWYPSSNFRNHHEVRVLDEELNSARTGNDSTHIASLEARLAAAVKAIENIDYKAVRKTQLQYLYREEGERLDLLYALVEGDTYTVPFGLLLARTNNVGLALSNPGYTVSKGFLEDAEACVTWAHSLEQFRDQPHEPGTGFTASAYGTGHARIAGHTLPGTFRFRNDPLYNKLWCEILFSGFPTPECLLKERLQELRGLVVLEDAPDGLAARGPFQAILYSRSEQSLRYFAYRAVHLAEDASFILGSILR